ncbi:MAG: methionyl-tRNA formyltransferase [Candidatus Omnitrophota bacterium]
MEAKITNKVAERIIIVAGCKSWNRRVYDEIISQFPGEWLFVSNPGQLNDALTDSQPRYIFFLHWSWMVPEEIIQRYECVCFHMTDVPFGRGGSPLQNLIIRGQHKTKLTALRMVEELDAGPVYFKEDLSLEGNAEEIYIRATYLSAQMIRRIIEEKPQPIQQDGASIIFKRRKPSESQIPEFTSMQALYDFIRMLDAEDYPHAYLEHAGFRYEFRRAALYDGRIITDVTISPIKEGKNE